MTVYPARRQSANVAAVTATEPVRMEKGEKQRRTKAGKSKEGTATVCGRRFVSFALKLRVL